ncbi:MAG: HDOD domain-containing protein [Planctomycetes bacterium]|nr:HDOD domain-containing protein [Planctomycetota bacterium]
MTQPKLLLARQPIFDRDQRVASYELLFRDTVSHEARVGDQQAATAELVARALIDVGLDTLVGSRRAWINVSREFLVGRQWSTLPPQRIVLEVLESVTAEPEVREARTAGFTIALDDFEITPRTVGLIPECDVVKIDCLQRDAADVRRAAKRLQPYGKRLLAEKVETRESFDACMEAGYTLFQGYFFARPSPVHGRQVKVDHTATMRLIAELNSPDISIERITQLIQADVALTYRLVCYANSAWLGREVRITHLRDVVTMLGIDRVRACATLLALGAMSAKPVELAVTALVRARYCELLGGLHGGEAQRHFVVGLFSVLDAYLDEPMTVIAPRLGLDAELCAALVDHSGRLGEVLEAAIACERADWEGRALKGYDSGELARAYLEALTWATRTQASLTN